MNSTSPSPGYQRPGEYPPYGENNYNAASSARHLNRTPSPTPSEQAFLNRKSLIDYKTVLNPRNWWKKEWIWYYVIFIVVIVLVILMSIYEKQIVHWLQPAANWMKNMKFGFLIPIAIFFIISFPPLFGQEILAILCGLVWGLWAGFAIVSAGTVLGELGNFFAFKYMCKARGDKLEKTKIFYGCLARVVREGGFKIAIIARYSAIPGHFTTAIFATCGMNIVVFTIAAILSLPKQFMTVYIGVLLEQSTTGTTSSSSKLTSDIVLVITILVTSIAMWYMMRQIALVKVDVIHDRRKARQLKGVGTLYGDGGSSTVFNQSDAQIPLTRSNSPSSDLPYDPPSHQQWDKQGHAIGYASDPQLYAPQPRRADNPFASGAISPSRTGSAQPGGGALGASRSPFRTERHESTDTVKWDIQSNQSAFPLEPVDGSKSQPPRIPEDDPFASSVTVNQLTYAPPAGPPPSQQLPARFKSPISSPPGSPKLPMPPFNTKRPTSPSYAFSSPVHSFAGGTQSGSGAQRPYSPPPPSYMTNLR